MDCAATECRVSSIDAALGDYLVSAALVEAALEITVAFLLQAAMTLVVEPMPGTGTVTALLLWTSAYARRRTAAATAASV